tara:strand:- start:583 stop:909 length:327 start_codon:yes stop_codon:yes gene_type:complete
MDEYYKEMYAISIDEHNIYYKCPFCYKNKIHIIKNTTLSLLNREEEVDSPCVLCGEKIVLNIGNYTHRQSLRPNKKDTSFSIDKTSIKRTKLLYKLEMEGRRQFDKTH